MAERHIVVIGAGIVGLCAADALLARGFRVTVIEKEAKPGDGCSYGNGGLIVPSHFVPLAAPGMIGMGLRMMLKRDSPFGVERLTDLETAGWMAKFARAATRSHVERSGPILRDLNLASKALYETLVADFGSDVGFAKRGLLMLCRTQHGLDDEAKLSKEANRLGLKATVVTADELRRLDPGVDFDVVGGVHFEDDAQLTPAAVMDALRERVLARGATIRQGEEVCALSAKDGRVVGVRLTTGDLTADETVVAAGAWSGRLVAPLGLRLPMLAGRGFGLTAKTPPQTPRIASILTEARIAVTPMLDGVRFVGSLELAQPNLVSTSPRVEGMRRSVPLYYPAFRPTDLDGAAWCGLRPCSPDGLPYIGRPARMSNLVVAAGHAMMGMSLGPITGKLVAEIVSGESPSHDLTLLSPDRYA